MDYTRLLPLELQLKSLPLSALGCNEVAWKAENVFEVIDILLAQSVIILGGDVYRLCDSSIEITYDSWFYSGDGGRESSEESCSLAKNYIQKYIDRNGQDFVYSLVCR